MSNAELQAVVRGMNVIARMPRGAVTVGRRNRVGTITPSSNEVGTITPGAANSAPRPRRTFVCIAATAERFVLQWSMRMGRLSM